MSETEWWKKTIIYQIYPRSFMDSNNDGIGDLQGIISKLDYLRDLGIGAIWLSPCFPSPMEDFGYDISNYVDIDPTFGTLSDMDELIKEAHDRTIKVILDYVGNHSSDQHPWFQESKKSRNNPKNDYYIWKDPKPDGSVPNNWICVPGGSAWEWCEERQQYYYHSFLKCQPDVNWKNSELQKEMLNVLRFWLDRGIDGFRIDMISWLYKDDLWRDNPQNPDYDPEKDMSFEKLLGTYTRDLPGLFKYLEIISKTVNEYSQRVIIGEVSYATKLESYPNYYGQDGTLVHLPAMFEFIKIPWIQEQYLNILKRYYKILPSFAWPNFQLGNHDRSRVVSRIGGIARAKSAALLLLTLKGTPFIYNGEELGMIDVEIPVEKIQDPTSKLEAKLARDKNRTPMQWDSSENAGFSRIEPWLPVSDDYKELNAQTELSNEKSMLSLYKALIRLRNSNVALQIGDFELLDLKNEHCIGFKRILHSKPAFGIFINFSDSKQEILIKEKYKLVLSSYLNSDIEKNENYVILRNNESILIQYLD